MSLYEIRRDIERLNQRINKLEREGQDDCSCNDEEEEGVFNFFQNKDGILIKSTPLTESHFLITVITRSGTEVGNGFVPKKTSSLVEKNGLKVLTIIHPTDEPFVPSDHYTFTYAGLGFGRGSCRNRNGLKCGGKIDLDRDCVDQTSYDNWCSNKCPFLHFCPGEWAWFRDTEGKC
ncbi:hypothetical protein [Bacillus cereus]|uniref:hypothetical protein n=1 Tax=Bacillus cereus TaxID=1396 RepID=UPI000279CD5B|nr:hypothetical protein [Bacillus cereus]EJR91829.1 hypothetical protein IKG_05691 [Bacillus cereus VD200]